MGDCRAGVLSAATAALARSRGKRPLLVVACGMAVVDFICRADRYFGGFAIRGVRGLRGFARGDEMAAGVGVAGLHLAFGALMGAINGGAGHGLAAAVHRGTTAGDDGDGGREGLRWLRQGEFVNLPDNAQNGSD